MSDGLHRISMAELMGAPQFPALVEEYAREGALAEMPPPSPRLARYQQIERSGLLAVFVWVQDGAIVGFLIMLVSPIPHYDRAVGIVESIFVAATYRASGAGLKLLHAAEAHARQSDCPVLLVTAPVASRLEALLPRCGYRAANTVFVKGMIDG